MIAIALAIVVQSQLYAQSNLRVSKASSANYSASNAVVKAQANKWLSTSNEKGFLENLGQMMDMKNTPVPFVLFKTEAPGLAFWITEQGITLQTLQSQKVPLSDKELEEWEAAGGKYSGRKKTKKYLNWERIDIALKGAIIRKENILKEEALQGHSNFFYPHCPDGIYGVKEYNKITIKEVYPGIDWVIYNSKEKGYKYDFVVHPGANYKQIKLLYKSKTPVRINENGELELYTLFGNIKENTPVSFLEKEEIETQFIQNYQKPIEVFGDAGYETSISFNLNLTSKTQHSTLIIDPRLVWTTFYGGSGNDGGGSVDVDPFGNVFVSAYTTSTNFPRLNAGTYFQGVFSNANSSDATILKFGNNGNLFWATHYGGSNIEGLDGCFLTTDATGNVFMTGTTLSNDFPVQSSAGAYYKPILTGGSDAFILKFDNNGARLWATLFGGNNQSDGGSSITTDNNGNIIVTGSTGGSNFPTLNAYQNSFGGMSDIFVAKFTNSGTLLWSTYHGGSNGETGFSVASDNAGNIYVSGIVAAKGRQYANSTVNFPLLNYVGSPLAYYQNTPGIGFFSIEDAVILKYNATGTLQWSTLYGGSGDEGLSTIAVDDNDNVFVTGTTASTDFPVCSTCPGYYDGAANNGLRKAYILKFDNMGVRQWATYYGSNNGSEYIDSQYSSHDNLVIDACGNVYMSFDTDGADIVTHTSISSCGVFDKNTINSGYKRDQYIVKFSNSGVRLWDTFLGGNGNDHRSPLALDKESNLFISGEWNNSTDVNNNFNNGTYPLMTPGGGAYYDATQNGLDDMFMAKLKPTHTYTTSKTNSTSCSPCNGSATATISCGAGNYNYRWSNGKQTLNSTGTSNTLNGLCAGTYWVEVKSDCAIDTLFYTITGPSCGCSNPPKLTLTTQTNESCFQSNGTATVAVTAGTGTAPFTYSWSNGATTAITNNLSAGSYPVIVTDALGCSAALFANITNSTPSIIPAYQIGCSGNISIVAIPNLKGGTWQWYKNGVLLVGENDSIINVSAKGYSSGNYSVVQNIAGSCYRGTTTILPAMGNPFFVNASTMRICPENTDSVTLLANGAIKYRWSHGLGTGNSKKVLPNTTTTYTVFNDDNGACKNQSATVTVTVSDPVKFNITTLESCQNMQNSITIENTSGTGPYTYLYKRIYKNGSSTLNGGATQNGLDTGFYVITVIDNFNCVQTDSVTLKKRTTLPVAAFTYSSPLCAGTNSCFTNTSDVGTYYWVIKGQGPIVSGNPTDFTSTLLNLCYTFNNPGTYVVSLRVKDAGSCYSTTKDSVIVTNCSGLNVTTNANSICLGSCATITSNPSGGTSPYTYSWSTGATTQNISPCPLSTTTYTVKVTDKTGVTATKTATVTINPAVTANITVGLINCSGAATGSATATGGGGTSPYTYSWSTGATTTGASSTIPNLAANTYSVVVTDSKGCTTTTSVTLTAPPPLLGQFTKGTAACSNCGCQEWLMVNATGGTPPYTYQWPDGYDKRYKNKVCPGNYTIKITDKNGCSVNVNVSTP